MYKLVTIYRRVVEEAQQEQFFSNTHLPLAEQLPALRRTEVSRIMAKPGGESRYHLMYELYFDSELDYLQAFMSEPGLKLLEALKPWAEASLVTWFHADSFTEAVGDQEEEE